jgi:hypothetical protein
MESGSDIAIAVGLSRKIAAARNMGAIISYNRISKGKLKSEVQEETKQKWKKEWNECAKATITKQFFPNVQDRLKMKINVSSKFATMVTGHGETREYVRRLKIMKHAACPCNNGEQTIDHLPYQCTLLHTPRELLRNKVLKTGNWSAIKHELKTKHLKASLTYTNSIYFEQL